VLLKNAVSLKIERLHPKRKKQPLYPLKFGVTSATALLTNDKTIKADISGCQDVRPIKNFSQRVYIGLLVGFPKVEEMLRRLK
jgi:hypothetical protein